MTDFSRNTKKNTISFLLFILLKTPSLKSAGGSGNLIVSTKKCPKFSALLQKFQEKPLSSASLMIRG
jgi:hypothetical protein